MQSYHGRIGMATSINAFALDQQDGKSVWFLGTLMTLKATAEQTNGAFGLIEQTLSPGFSPPLHVHHREDEAFYLLEGEASFYCGDQRFSARPGTLVFFPRNIPHWFRIEGNGPARLLQFNFPSGLENFFVEAGEPATDAKSPPDGPPNFEKMLAAAAKYDLEILGPPPA